MVTIQFKPRDIDGLVLPFVVCMGAWSRVNGYENEYVQLDSVGSISSITHFFPPTGSSTGSEVIERDGLKLQENVKNELPLINTDNVLDKCNRWKEINMFH